MAFDSWFGQGNKGKSAHRLFHAPQGQRQRSLTVWCSASTNYVVAHRTPMKLFRRRPNTGSMNSVRSWNP